MGSSLSGRLIGRAVGIGLVGVVVQIGLCSRSLVRRLVALVVFVVGVALVSAVVVVGVVHCVRSVRLLDVILSSEFESK